MTDLTLVGISEKILRACAAGILMVEGMNPITAQAIAEGTLPIQGNGVDAQVTLAVRKSASVLLTLRAHDALKLPSDPPR